LHDIPKKGRQDRPRGKGGESSPRKSETIPPTAIYVSMDFDKVSKKQHEGKQLFFVNLCPVQSKGKA
jgi:hypothetical protein